MKRNKVREQCRKVGVTGGEENPIVTRAPAMANVATILMLFSLLGLALLQNGQAVNHGYNIFIQLVNRLCAGEDEPYYSQCRFGFYRSIAQADSTDFKKRSQGTKLCTEVPISRKHVLTSRFCSQPSRSGKPIDEDLVIYEVDKYNDKFVQMAPIYSEEVSVTDINQGNPCQIFQLKFNGYYVGRCNPAPNKIGTGFYTNDSLVGILTKDLSNWSIIKVLTNKNIKEICKVLGSEHVADQWKSCSSYIK